MLNFCIKGCLRGFWALKKVFRGIPKCPEDVPGRIPWFSRPLLCFTDILLNLTEYTYVIVKNSLLITHSSWFLQRLAD